jgi:hypothetical protein
LAWPDPRPQAKISIASRDMVTAIVKTILNLSVHLTGVSLRFTPAGDFCEIMHLVRCNNASAAPKGVQLISQPVRLTNDWIFSLEEK